MGEDSREDQWQQDGWDQNDSVKDGSGDELTKAGATSEKIESADDGDSHADDSEQCSFVADE